MQGIAMGVTVGTIPISVRFVGDGRIFAREYCSLWLSLGGTRSVDSPSAPPRALCPSALIFSSTLL
jgi:hypothetical protein